MDRMFVSDLLLADSYVQLRQFLRQNSTPVKISFLSLHKLIERHAVENVSPASPKSVIHQMIVQCTRELYRNGVIGDDDFAHHLSLLSVSESRSRFPGDQKSHHEHAGFGNSCASADLQYFQEYPHSMHHKQMFTEQQSPLGTNELFSDYRNIRQNENCQIPEEHSNHRHGNRYTDLECGGIFQNCFQGAGHAETFIRSYFKCPHGNHQWLSRGGDQAGDKTIYCSCRGPAFTSSTRPVLLRIQRKEKGYYAIQIPLDDKNTHAYHTYCSILATCGTRAGTAANHDFVQPSSEGMQSVDTNNHPYTTSTPHHQWCDSGRINISNGQIQHPGNFGCWDIGRTVNHYGDQYPNGYSDLSAGGKVYAFGKKSTSINPLVQTVWETNSPEDVWSRNGLRNAAINRNRMSAQGDRGDCTTLMLGHGLRNFQESKSLSQLLDGKTAQLPMSLPLDGEEPMNFDRFMNKIGLDPKSDGDLMYCVPIEKEHCDMVGVGYEILEIMTSVLFLCPANLYTMYKWLVGTLNYTNRFINIDGIFGFVRDSMRPLLCFGVSDIDLRPGRSKDRVTRSFRALCHLLANSENANVVSVALAALNWVAMKFFGLPLLFAGSISDMAKGIIAGVQKYADSMAEQHPEMLEAKSHVCFPHVMRALREGSAWREHIHDPKNIELIRWRVYLLYRNGTHEQFLAAIELFRAELCHMGEENFLDYFLENYGPESQCQGMWYYGSCGVQGNTPNNNAIENYFGKCTEFVTKNVGLDEFFTREAQKLLSYDRNERMGYENGKVSRGDPEKVCDYLDIGLAGMMMKHQDIKEIKDWGLYMDEGTSAERTFFCNGSACLGNEITDTTILDWQRTRRGHIDRLREMTMEDIHNNFYRDRKNLENFVRCGEGLCRVNVYKHGDLSAPVTQFHGKTHGFHCTCMRYCYRTICHSVLFVADHLDEMNKPLDLLLGATLCRKSDNTPLVLTGDNNKDIKVEKKSWERAKRNMSTSYYKEFGLEQETVPLGLTFLQNLTQPQTKKMAMARGLRRDQYFGQKSKQRILEEIIIGTCLGDVLGVIVDRVETSPHWYHLHVRERQMAGTRRYSRGPGGMFMDESDTEELFDSYLSRPRAKYPPGFTSLGDHERKKENDFKKRKMVAQQSQEAAAFVKTVCSKVTEQDVVEFRQKTTSRKKQKRENIEDELASKVPSPEEANAWRQSVAPAQTDGSAEEKRSFVSSAQTQLKSVTIAKCSHPCPPPVGLGRKNAGWTAYAIRTYQGNDSHRDTTNACVALSCSIVIFFLLGFRDYDPTTSKGLRDIVNGGCEKVIAATRKGNCGEYAYLDIEDVLRYYHSNLETLLMEHNFRFEDVRIVERRWECTKMRRKSYFLRDKKGSYGSDKMLTDLQEHFESDCGWESCQRRSIIVFYKKHQVCALHLNENGKKEYHLIETLPYEFTDNEGMKHKSGLRIVCYDLHWLCKALYWFWLSRGGRGRQREQPETLDMALECKSNPNFVAEELLTIIYLSTRDFVHGSVKEELGQEGEECDYGMRLDVGDTPKALKRRLLPDFGDTDDPIDSYPDTPIRFTGYQEGKLDLQKDRRSGKRFTQEGEVGRHQKCAVKKKKHGQLKVDHQPSSKPKMAKALIQRKTQGRIKEVGL
jgi:hypothetical protein